MSKVFTGPDDWYEGWALAKTLAWNGYSVRTDTPGLYSIGKVQGELEEKDLEYLAKLGFDLRKQSPITAKSDFC